MLILVFLFRADDMNLNFHYTNPKNKMNKRLILCLAATLSIGSLARAGSLEPSGSIPSEPGSGLNASFWNQPAGSLKSLAREGLQIIREEPANATFLATTMQYAGNDLLRLEQWLGEDASSLHFEVKPEVDVLGDSLLRFTGYIAIPEAGKVTFSSSSDDGSIVWIGGKKIIHNDGYGAAPGDFPEGSANFARPGLYPIEIAFFNGDWIDAEAGFHGESIIRFSVNGKPAAPGSLYSRSDLEGQLSFPSNPLTDPVEASVASNN